MLRFYLESPFPFPLLGLLIYDNIQSVVRHFERACHACKYSLHRTTLYWALEFAAVPVLISLAMSDFDGDGDVDADAK